jgi:ribosomal peptide maturation radical SAM protein 1
MSAVVLVSMPFGPLFWPSLGLSLLKPPLVERGISVSIKYFTIPFAERIGESLYSTIAMSSRVGMREQAGEWIFSHALAAQTSEQVERYVEEILRRRDGYLVKRAAASPSLIAGILRARTCVDPFLDRCADDIQAEHPSIVGFTSIFQQHVASLALARRVKDRLPNVLIVFGGANCEGVMGAETLRQFPWVDAAVSGEGDIVFPDLVGRHLAGQPISGMPGVRTRDRLKQEFAFNQFLNAPIVETMDALPYPDYREYFEQFGRSRFDADWQPGTFMETSRGCWWGERMHCTFCGLNGATMRYRSKSAARALDEMTAIAATHKNADIQIVDNILDLDYFKTLLPELAARQVDFGLFYETKSNLKREQVRLLRAAGVRQIQPGIESLSDAILTLMRKGVTALHNIQVLKWCKEFGVTPLWNLIWGFPGEPPGEYERMARLAPLLVHLPPPVSFNGLRLDRFSPNFVESARFGFDDVAPMRAYEHVYQVGGPALANLAYFFRYRHRDGRDPATYVWPLMAALRRWQRSAVSADLFSVDTGEHLILCDLRPSAAEPLVILDEIDRAIHKSCDAIVDRAHVTRAVSSAFGAEVADTRISDRLDALVARGVVIEDNGRFLSLAVPLGEYVPAPAVVARFYRLLAARGRRDARGVVIACRDSTRRRDAVPPRRRARIARGRIGPSPKRGQGLRPEQFSVTPHGELVVRSHRPASERRG